MNVLKKEIMPKSSPLWIGFKHFFVTAIVFFLVTTLSFVWLWAWGLSGLIVGIVFFTLSIISLIISPFWLKKELLLIENQKQLLNTSFIVYLIVIIFLFFLGIFNDLSISDLISLLIFFILISLGYYFISKYMFKKIILIKK